MRGLLFYDTQALWWNNLEDNQFVPQANGTYVITHPDGTYRDFLPEVDSVGGMFHAPRLGLDRGHWHNGVGGGMRLYLKSINIPLLGFDFGYGLESHETRFYIALGLSD